MNYYYYQKKTFKSLNPATQSKTSQQNVTSKRHIKTVTSKTSQQKHNDKNITTKTSQQNRYIENGTSKTSQRSITTKK